MYWNVVLMIDDRHDYNTLLDVSKIFLPSFLHKEDIVAAAIVSFRHINTKFIDVVGDVQSHTIDNQYTLFIPKLKAKPGSATTCIYSAAYVWTHC